jgi:hypothetical protein
VQLGTVYGGATEDANIAWTAASAYRYSGGEGAVWVIQSESTLDAQALIKGLRAGKSR